MEDLRLLNGEKNITPQNQKEFLVGRAKKNTKEAQLDYCCYAKSPTSNAKSN